MMQETPSSEDTAPVVYERRIRIGQTVKVVLWLLLAAIVVVFAFFNTDKVEVDWVFGDADVWLWLIVAGSAVAGFLIGIVTMWRRS